MPDVVVDTDATERRESILRLVTPPRLRPGRCLCARLVAFDRLTEGGAQGLEQPAELQQDWWKRAPPGSARVFVDYDHHPTDADVSALEALGVEVTFRFTYLDTVSATAPFEAVLDSESIRALPGVVMVEDLGLAEPNMHEAVPTMGVDQVWTD